MAKILCATDFSPAAEQAVEIGARLAHAFGDDLELLHVVPRSLFVHPEMVVDALRPLQEAAEQALAGRVGRLTAEGVRATGRATIGAVDGCLLDAAAAPETRLVLLGSHGRKGAARFFLGSVAERVVRRARCPVLVVPEAAVRLRGHLATGGPALVVTAGIDLSPASEAALRWLETLARAVPCQVNLVHTFSPARESDRLGLPWSPDELEPEPEVAAVLERELRARIARDPGTQGFRLRVRPGWGDPAAVLVEEAESDDADLLVVGSRQRLGSTAVATLRAATMPVLTVPEPASATEPPAIPVAPLRTVLVATDFSATAAATVEQACRLLAGAGGTLVLCHAVEPAQAGTPSAPRESVETALLALVPPGAASRRIRARTLIQESGPPSQAILQAARRVDAEAVVVGSGRGGGLATLGSVARALVAHAPIPVFVVPAARGAR